MVPSKKKAVKRAGKQALGPSREAFRRWRRRNPGDPLRAAEPPPEVDIRGGTWERRRPAVEAGEVLISLGRNIFGEMIPSADVAERAERARRTRTLYWSVPLPTIPQEKRRG